MLIRSTPKRIFCIPCKQSTLRKGSKQIGNIWFCKDCFSLVPKSPKKQRPELRQDNTTGTTGVTHGKTRTSFRSYIDINKKRTGLGHFKTLEEAVIARKEAEKLYKC
jgi:hypothetical protein